MAEAFIAEIKMFGGNFAIRGYALCDGQLLSIAQNTALFSLIGTIYGGNGQTTFGLPDMRGRVPMFWGTGPGLSNRSLGEQVGSENVTLISTEMPQHGHAANALAAAGNQTSPSGGTWAQVTAGRNPTPLYSNQAVNTTLNPQVLGVAGGSQPHNNLSPYQVINFIIALVGIFPPRN